MRKTHHSLISSWLASALYLFSNYRISDVYVRGALGEVIAMMFVPWILLGIYEVLYEEHPNTTSLIIGFTGVALSHNLTLLLCAAGFASMLLLNIRHMTFCKIRKITKAAFISIALSFWFLIPMMEHASFQPYYLHYYASSSDMASHALASWQYLVNETVFGLSGSHLSPDELMVVTPGMFLLLLPVLYLFDINSQKTKTDQFARLCCISGYLFAFACSRYIPWDKLFFLRILQFPWRLMTLACPLLAFASAHIVHRLFNTKTVFLLLLTILINGTVLLVPCLNRQVVIQNSTTYQELLDGSIIDPYYADTSYNRIEVAGADYLPMGFLDYKNASHCITDLSGNEISCEIQKDESMTFLAPKNTQIIVPLSAYKGYHIISDNEEINWNTKDGRISFYTGNHTEFTILYEKTALHKASIMISGLSLCLLVIHNIHKKSRSN